MKTLSSGRYDLFARVSVERATLNSEIKKRFLYFRTGTAYPGALYAFWSTRTPEKNPEPNVRDEQSYFIFERDEFFWGGSAYDLNTHTLVSLDLSYVMVVQKDKMADAVINPRKHALFFSALTPWHIPQIDAGQLDLERRDEEEDHVLWP